MLSNKLELVLIKLFKLKTEAEKKDISKGIDNKWSESNAYGGILFGLRQNMSTTLSENQTLSSDNNIFINYVYNGAFDDISLNKCQLTDNNKMQLKRVDYMSTD